MKGDRINSVGEMKKRLNDMIKRHRQFIIFALIGGVNTVVDFLVFTVFNEMPGLAIEICQAFGYSAGLISSFILNRSFTFKKKNTAGIIPQIVRFLLINGISVLVSMMLIRWFYLVGINEYISKVLVTGIVMVINYVGYKLFVFSGGDSRNNR